MPADVRNLAEEMLSEITLKIALIMRPHYRPPIEDDHSRSAELLEGQFSFLSTMRWNIHEGDTGFILIDLLKAFLPVVPATIALA